MENINAIVTDNDGTTLPKSFTKQMVQSMSQHYTALTENTSMNIELEKNKKEQEGTSGVDLDWLNTPIDEKWEQQIKAAKTIYDILGELQQSSDTPAREKVAHVQKEILQGNITPDYAHLLSALNEYAIREGKAVPEFYNDVAIALNIWDGEGKDIYTFSRGSVGMQEALYEKSAQGNLSTHIKRFFDTNDIGGKKDKSSYHKLNDLIETQPRNTIFFSDDPGEVKAAADAEWNSYLVQRPGNKPIQENELKEIQEKATGIVQSFMQAYVMMNSNK